MLHVPLLLELLARIMILSFLVRIILIDPFVGGAGLKQTAVQAAPPRVQILPRPRAITQLRRILVNLI